VTIFSDIDIINFPSPFPSYPTKYQGDVTAHENLEIMIIGTALN
jgi:hypothetical protein